MSKRSFLSRSSSHTPSRALAFFSWSFSIFNFASRLDVLPRFDRLSPLKLPSLSSFPSLARLTRSHLQTNRGYLRGNVATLT